MLASYCIVLHLNPRIRCILSCRYLRYAHAGDSINRGLHRHKGSQCGVTRHMLFAPTGQVYCVCVPCVSVCCGQGRPKRGKVPVTTTQTGQARGGAAENSRQLRAPAACLSLIHAASDSRRHPRFPGEIIPLPRRRASENMVAAASVHTMRTRHWRCSRVLLRSHLVAAPHRDDWRVGAHHPCPSIGRSRPGWRD